jgi:hypothetical protein
MVNIMIGLPNLGINLTTQFILDVVFHWSGIYSLLAYMIGTGLSVQYSILWAVMTKTNFRIGNREYKFNQDDKARKDREI